MTLLDLLTERKPAILKRWHELAAATYPRDTAAFLLSKKDPFGNPVGQRLAIGVDAMFDNLVCGQAPEEARSFLEDIIKVRAVQDFTPARAVGFVLLLKTAVREELRRAGPEGWKDEAGRGLAAEEVLTFESRIDDLVLLAFDLFMGCREKLFELRANEIRNRTHRLLVKADLISEIPSFKPDLAQPDPPERPLDPAQPGCGGGARCGSEPGGSED